MDDDITDNHVYGKDDDRTDGTVYDFMTLFAPQGSTLPSWTI